MGMGIDMSKVEVNISHILYAIALIIMIFLGMATGYSMRVPQKIYCIDGVVHNKIDDILIKQDKLCENIRK